jgi:hypothetical protein
LFFPSGKNSNLSLIHFRSFRTNSLWDCSFSFVCPKYERNMFRNLGIFKWTVPSVLVFLKRCFYSKKAKNGIFSTRPINSSELANILASTTNRLVLSKIEKFGLRKLSIDWLICPLEKEIDWHMLKAEIWHVLTIFESFTCIFLSPINW